MSKLDLDLSPLSDAEEARIRTGIAADPDAPEATDEQLAQARPFAEAFPELAANLRRSRGAQKAPTKELVSIRLDPGVLAAFKATGAGWQTRMNEVLAEAARKLKAA